MLISLYGEIGCILQYPDLPSLSMWLLAVGTETCRGRVGWGSVGAQPLPAGSPPFSPSHLHVAVSETPESSCQLIQLLCLVQEQLHCSVVAAESAAGDTCFGLSLCVSLCVSVYERESEVSVCVREGEISSLTVGLCCEIRSAKAGRGS